MAQGTKRRSGATERQWRRNRARTPAWRYWNQADDNTRLHAARSRRALWSTDHVRGGRTRECHDRGAVITLSALPRATWDENPTGGKAFPPAGRSDNAWRGIERIVRRSLGKRRRSQVTAAGLNAREGCSKWIVSLQ